MKKTNFFSIVAILLVSLGIVAFNKSNNKNSKKMKTYVLVHGAWAGKFAWNEVKPLLEKEGNKVVTLDLPAHGDDKTPIGSVTLQSYVDAVVQLIDKQEGKVILVGHSMGGMVISQVAENRPSKIEKLVYLSAYLPSNGQDLQSLSATDAGSLIGPNLVFLPDYSGATIKPEFVEKVFAADCSADIKKLVLDKHKNEPLAPFQGKVTLTDANFGAVPKYFIETLKDVGVSTANQEKMIQANGTVKKVYKLDCGHSPYFAMPKELSTILNVL
jgi:pimeloyl-ACP methyl ester carboxylesterase